MSSEELYLVAHKVRGQPAFDIAHQLQIGNEEGWIIPTSGHRAYPWWWIELANIDDMTQLNFETVYDHHPVRLNGPGPCPQDWPDHYATTVATAATPRSGQSILADLGLGQSSTPIRRL